MQNPNEHENENENTATTTGYGMKIKKSESHNNSLKSIKNIYRCSSQNKSYKYADIGFTITKQKSRKYVAHCRVCNRTLGNTAYARLKGHRNICREAPLKANGSECFLYPNGNNETYVVKQPDNSLSEHCVSQAPVENFTSPLNLLSPKKEVDEDSSGISMSNVRVDSPPSQLLNQGNQLKLNMIEVLLLIKYNKGVLFGDNTNRSIEMWTKVLRKAESFGLAPTGVPWTYARDSLYSIWRLHTLQKKNAIESGEKSLKFNIVDLSILQIENAPLTNQNSSFESDDLYETANEFLTDRTTTTSNSSTINWDSKSTKSIQTSDEVYKADLRLKLLQCEALEIENYKRSLETFELERKLQIYNSKFAAKYFPSVEILSNERPNGFVRIELDE